MEFATISQEILSTIVQTLFPTYGDFQGLVIDHIWRDRDYVGVSADGKVASWVGFSVNLGEIDRSYRAIFIDRVENQLDMDQQIELFGELFSEAIKDIDRFIVAYITGFTPHNASLLKQLGYVPRLMKRAAHGCIIMPEHEFVTCNMAVLALRLIRLMRLYQELM